MAAKSTSANFFSVLSLLVAVTILFGTIYVCCQQILRLSANDPQIQMAEDTATQLSHSQNLSLLSHNSINPAQSLQPFLVVYDSNGNVLKSEITSGLNLPSGVFQTVKAGGEKRFTWQPSSNARIAAVIVPYNNGFVLVGRSLREVEKREDTVLHLVIFGWGVTVFLLLALTFLPKIWYTK